MSDQAYRVGKCFARLSKKFCWCMGCCEEDDSQGLDEEIVVKNLLISVEVCVVIDFDKKGYRLFGH